MSIEQYFVPDTRKKPIRFLSKMNICADCQLNIALCPWLHSGKSVPGWTAERSYIKYNTVDPRSYHITDCPLYIPPRCWTRRKIGAGWECPDGYGREKGEPE